MIPARRFDDVVTPFSFVRPPDGGVGVVLLSARSMVMCPLRGHKSLVNQPNRMWLGTEDMPSWH